MGSLLSRLARPHPVRLVYLAFGEDVLRGNLDTLTSDVLELASG